MVIVATIDEFYEELRKSAEPETASTSSRKRKSGASTPPLLIFPSTSDVDSICAFKIIRHVLESDCIKYECCPVSSYKGFHKYAKASPYFSGSSRKPVTILLINWGCHVDLKWMLQMYPIARVFVVDSHRPIQLSNFSDKNDQVVVLYTQDDETVADFGLDFNVSDLANASYLNGDDEIGENLDCANENDISSDDEEDGNRNSRKRRTEYYLIGTSHGNPSGCLMYELSCSLQKNTNELLWLACVALTDQSVHQRSINERYDETAKELVIKWIPWVGTNDPPTRDALSISYEAIPKLMLLPVWNLFDSMLCSPYTARKLKTWSEDGLKTMKRNKVTMGLSLLGRKVDKGMGLGLLGRKVDKGKSPYMDIDFKQIRERFERYLPKNVLNDLYYEEFMLIHGCSSKVSAADVVYGVTALLESSLDSDGSTASENFEQACDAFNNTMLLESGMKKAIEVQKAIHTLVSSVLAKKGSIISHNKFRLVKLPETVECIKVLCYPMALTRFSQFLVDALEEEGQPMKPLISICKQKYAKVLVVGICGRPEIGHLRGNTFGSVFGRAAKTLGAKHIHELFESSWMTLDSLYVDTFIIRLEKMMPILD